MSKSINITINSLPNKIEKFVLSNINLRPAKSYDNSSQKSYDKF